MTVISARFLQAVVSAIAGAIWLVPAHAEPRTTSFAVFLHIGPGRQYAVTDELPTGASVDVNGCEQNWCRVRYGNAIGWIDQRMLAAAASPRNVTGECVDFARTGWPDAGDHERLCLAKPR